MKNPKLIEITEEQKTYTLPTYKVVDGSIEDGTGLEIKFCKGSTADSTVPRQEGVFVESILMMAKTHLESVNVGELSTRETAVAITKLDEALMWLNKRAEDRKLREVQGTYKK